MVENWLPSSAARRGLFCSNYSRRRGAYPVWSELMATPPINDYYVIPSRRGERPERWGWEIRRKSKPLGVKLTGDRYQSQSAAQFAGKQALADFLYELLKEGKRK